MGVEKLLDVLAKKYDSSKVLPATKMMSSEHNVYFLNPITKDNFKNFNPKGVKENFRVVAVDGGSAELFNTPYWGIGFAKFRARLIEFDVKEKKGTTKEVAKKEGFVLFIDDKDVPDSDSIVKKKFYEKGNYLKREETRFVRDLLKQGFMEQEDLLLLDGTIGNQFFEKELLKMHPDTVGISKRSEMTINKYSAASWLTIKAQEFGKNDKPWYVYPLVKKYPGENVAELLYGTFVGNPKNCFRVDIPVEPLTTLNVKDQYEFISERLAKIAIFSLDPKYRDYPYPLGAVHTDAVMRPIDRDRAKDFVKRKFEEMDLSPEARVLIMKDIENDYWYERFRKRAL